MTCLQLLYFYLTVFAFLRLKKWNVHPASDMVIEFGDLAAPVSCLNTCKIQSEPVAFVYSYTETKSCDQER